MRVDFFFDPVCPWSWITSRWVIGVAGRRDDLDVRWRAFSLAMNDDGKALPDDARDLHHAGLRALRVVEAVWAEHGDGPIGDLYTALGTRVHHGADSELAGIGEALEAAGLDRSFAAQADEARWDTEVRGSMDEALDAVGGDAGTPIILLADGDRVGGVFGPVLSPAPTGADADRLFDAVVTAALTPGFHELSRTRDTAPELPPPPVGG